MSLGKRCHLAGRNGFVPVDHLLWLQNHFLIHELSWTLHKGLEEKQENTSKPSTSTNVSQVYKDKALLQSRGEAVKAFVTRMSEKCGIFDPQKMPSFPSELK